MANLFSSSIGKKLIMSLSGLFLITFLLIHLTINSFLLLDGVFGFEEGQMFNAGAHFMGTFPLIKIVEPILGVGFLIHIIYSLTLTLQNKKARGSVKYASGDKTENVEWSSKNMFILGLAMVAFLVVHLMNFWVRIKITGDVGHAEFPYLGTGMVHGEDAYTLVNSAFQNIYLVIAYIVGSVALAFHLTHGFWSAFQTIGWNNQIWMKRLKVIGAVIAWMIGLGFSVIALAQYLFF